MNFFNFLIPSPPGDGKTGGIKKIKKKFKKLKKNGTLVTQAQKNGFVTMSINEKLAFIEKIEELHSMPSLFSTLMVKINNPKSTVAEIEKLIDMDPDLVSYILKLSNSLIFGLREEVSSISRAIALLGMSNLRSMLTSYYVRLLCNAISNLHVRDYIWHHSLSVAVMSKIIAEKIYGVEQPNFYVFGFLHDIGKTVLYMHNAQNFEKSLEQGILKDMDFVYTEKQVFGFSHVETGYFMIHKLGFSKKMKNVILFHHNPQFGPVGDIMHWIVSFSNELAHYIEDNKPVDLQRYLVEINLPEKELQEIIPSAQNRIKYYKELL
jgi:putative nucleotidyltransferase with HDIG domain